MLGSAAAVCIGACRTSSVPTLRRGLREFQRRGVANLSDSASPPFGTASPRRRSRASTGLQGASQGVSSKPTRRKDRAPRRSENRRNGGIVARSGGFGSGRGKSTPRFQPFGRGEGSRVAEGLWEDFGMNALPEEGAPRSADREDDHIKRLEGELQMRGRVVAEMLEREPRLASQTTEDVSERFAWLKDRLRLGDDQARSLVFRRPSFLCRSVEDGMEAKVRWIQDYLRLGDEEIASMIAVAPNVLSSGVQSGLGPKLEWLSKRLKLSRDELAMVLTTCPQILTSSVESALQPRLDWLQSTLEIGDGTLRERVLSNPWLLNLSKDNKLEPTLEFLRTELLLDESDIRKTLFRQPRMFLTQLRPALASVTEWLRARVGVSEREALAVVRRDARLLLRSTDVLDTKVDFFMRKMGATREDMRFVLLTSPNVLLVSVDIVLAPRVAALEKAGVRPVFAVHWNAVAFGPTGEDFDEWVRKQAKRSHRR